MRKNEPKNIETKGQDVQRVTITLPNDICKEMDRERMSTLTPRSWWVRKAIEGELKRIKDSKEKG